MDIASFIKDRIQGKVPFLSKRSHHWPTVRKHWIKLNSECAACGSKTKLQVHHIVPFHINPMLELDFSNLITLCEAKLECHLEIGHHDNFKNENPNVLIEAAIARKKHGLPKLEMVIPNEI